MNQSPFLIKNVTENVKYGKFTLLAMMSIEIIMFVSTLFLPSSFGIYRVYYQRLCLIFAIGCFLMIHIVYMLGRNIEKYVHQINVILGLFSLFIAQWAIGITILDFYHLSTLKETVLITCIFWIMIAFTFHPILSVFLMSVVVVMYALEITLICKSSVNITLGSVINLLILAVLACFVSMMRYRSAQKQYESQMTILEKNKALERANLEILKVKREIEQSNIEKTQFILNMAHEFRNPINTILGMSELISEQSIEAETKTYLDEIEASGIELLKLANEVVDFSKIDNGFLPMNERRYNLSQLFQQNLESARGCTIGKDIDVSIRLDDNLPEFFIGDDIKLGQVINNLLCNAVKFIKNGKITLSASAIQADQRRMKLKIEIHSIGEQLPKDGTEIGLNLAKKYLKMMHGTIAEQNNSEHESTLTIQVNQKISEKFTKKIQEYQAPKARILVVDDSQMNLSVVKGILRKTKAKVDTCNNGQDAVRRIEATAYHVILLDHLMPGMDGIEVLDQIRMKTTSKNKRTPVIAVTGNNITDAQKKYLDTGFDGYLSKPIIGSALEQVVFQFLPKELCMIQDHENIKPEFSQQESEMIQFLESHHVQVQIALQYVNQNFSQYQLNIHYFLEESKEKLDEIREALEKNYLEQLGILYHSMKSNARMIGLTDLADTFERCERIVKSSQSDKLSLATQQLMVTWDESNHILRQALEVSEQKTRRKVQKIIRLLEDFELDDAIQKCKQLQSQVKDEEIQSILKEVQLLMEQFEYEKAIQMLQEAPL